MSPNAQSVEKSTAPKPLVASTPANDLLSKPTFSVVSSTPTTISIKKSLFGTDENQTDIMEKPKLKKALSAASKKPTISRQRSVHFEQQNSSVEYADCFGFEDGCSPVVPIVASPPRGNGAAVHKFATPYNKPRRRSSSKSSARKLSKRDFERQSSLLSFGSASQNELDDDVFSVPPRMPDLPTPGGGNDTTGHASSQLETSQSSTGNYDSLNRPKHFTVNPTSDLSVRIKRKKNSSSSGHGKAKSPAASDFSGWSEADLSAPGFRMNSRDRRALRKSREPVDDSPQHSPLRRSPRKSGQVKNSNGKRSCAAASPEYTSAKRLRVELEMITPPVTPIHAGEDNPTHRRSPRKHNQDYSKRTPHVCKVRERLRLAEKDWSMCSSDNSNDNIAADLSMSENVPVFSPVKQSSYKPVKHSSPVKRNYLKKKYCYPVGTKSLRSKVSGPKRTQSVPCAVIT